MQIVDQLHYVVGKLDAELKNYCIDVKPESAFDSISWDGSTRISPAWPVQWGDQVALDAPTRELTDTSCVAFIGPISPPKVYNTLQRTLFRKLEYGDVWLTLGYFNFVVFLRDEREVQAVRDFCFSHGCTAEFWMALDEPHDEPDDSDIRCDDVEYYNPLEFRGGHADLVLAESPQNHLKAVAPSIDASVKQAFHEFEALRKVIRHRAKSAFEPFCLDVEQTSENLPSFEECLDNDVDLYDSDDRDRRLIARERANIVALSYRDTILNVTAGLSRQVSQALSGTSPIIQTECHFWPHSFLGIGTANLALRNLSAFIVRQINGAYFDHNFNIRMEQLASELPLFGGVDRAVSEMQLHEFDSCTLGADEPSDDATAHSMPITYYSAREGFRYGAYTASAPLLSVSGCNSKQWNLSTISHELSHAVVAPKLYRLRAKLDSFLEDNCDMGCGDLLEKKSGTVEDAALTLLSTMIVFKEALRIGANNFERFKDLPAGRLAKFFVNGFNQAEHEIEEDLVHLFDYFHFYNQDATAYVSGIWQSWAVQPSIALKFERYVERTAIALAVKHVGAPNWRELTVNELSSATRKEAFWHQTIFRDRLAKHLNEQSDSIYKYLKRSWPILALFCLLFKSTQLAKLAEIEERATSDARWLHLYDVSGLHFPTITNPLRFTRDFATDKTPDGARSAWLLSVLAHSDPSGHEQAG